MEVGRDLALHLRQEEHCDLVIALTHMRAPNDERLARSVAEIDVVLGGHDHDYVRRTRVEGCASLVPFASASPQSRPPSHTHIVHAQWTKVLSGGALVVKSGTDFRDVSELIVTPVVHEPAPHHYDSGPLHQNLAANGPRFRYCRVLPPNPLAQA